MDSGTIQEETEDALPTALEVANHGPVVVQLVICCMYSSCEVKGEPGESSFQRCTTTKLYANLKGSRSKYFIPGKTNKQNKTPHLYLKISF